jgi:hypothetical protein
LPFSISVNASVYESDLTWWNQLSTKVTGTDVYTDSHDFDPGTLKGDPTNPLSLVIKIYTKAGVLLETKQFTDLVLESYSERTAVQGRGEITLSFTGTACEFCGENA